LISAVELELQSISSYPAEAFGNFRSYKKTASHVHIIVVVKPKRQGLIFELQRSSKHTKHRYEAKVPLKTLLAHNWSAASQFNLRKLKIHIKLLFFAHFRHIDPILRRQAYLPRPITRDLCLQHSNLSIFEHHTGRVHARISSVERTIALSF
jgi:hypothetical protein